MKKIAFIFCLAFYCVQVTAQPVWNKKLPISSPTSRILPDANQENGRFLITAGCKILEFDLSGTVTGYAEGWPGLFSTFIRKNHFGSSGNPFYTFCTRNIQVSGPNVYSIIVYKPGEGFSSGLQLSDSIGSLSNGGPAIVEINEHSFWVLGRKFVRQITVSDQAVVTMDWEKPLGLPQQQIASAAILNGNNVFAVTNKGSLIALDLDGNVLWTQNNQNLYDFRGIAAVNDGLVACGSIANGNACLAKFNFNGDFKWASTPGDATYNALIVNLNGDLIVTGNGSGNEVVLVKTDADGNLIWRQMYQTGQGASLIASPDGGYFLIASTNQNKYYAIKTNELGETAARDDRALLVRERGLKNSAIELIQVPSSSLFFNGTDSGFILPADSSTTSVFAFSPWISGKDSQEDLHLSASTFGDLVNSNFRAGIASSIREDFNRVWLVTRDEIDRVRRDFGEDNDLDNPVSLDLLTWPAKGNPNFQQNLDFSIVSTNPDSLPAPFIDYNGDGIYNVFEGDYPKLLGDQMLWWTFTDQGEVSNSTGQDLGIDALVSAYIYDCPQNGAVSNSLFADYNIINRSGQGFTDAFLAFHTDFDIGCPDDDNIGSLPEANSFYAYNMDAVDGQPGSTCAGGIETFGDHVPVQTITMLNQSLDHSMFYNRGGTGGPAGSGDPSSPLEMYYYQQSIWKDGTHLTYGGTGNNPGSTDFTNHIFSGNPSDPQGWSMCTENLGMADRRMVNSHGPYSFAAGDTFTMQLAFTFHPDIPHPCPDITGLVKPTILQIQQWHDDGTLNAHLDLGSVLSLIPGQSILLNATQSDPATNYAWSTGQNTPTITVNQTGEYTVTVTPASGCAYTETVLVKSASGTSSPTLPDWRVLPNPASEFIKIVLENGEAPFTALLYNAQGQLASTENSNGNGLEMSVSNLPAGFYWVEIWQKAQFLGSRKVVVSR